MLRLFPATVSSTVFVSRATAASNESSTMFVLLEGGYQEPGQDCTAGRCTPRPHGGGEGPSAGQQLHRGQG